MHFLFVWAQTLQDGRTLYSKKSYVFLFFDVNAFWQENDITGLTAKIKFQDMAKQNNKLVIVDTTAVPVLYIVGQ